MAIPFIDQLKRRSGPFTLIITGFCIVVFMLTSYGNNQQLLNHFWFIPDYIVEGQVWRLLSPSFLHFMIAGFPLHLMFNMMWWMDLGGAIERYYSWQTLAWMSIVIGILSNAAEYYVAGNYRFGGMSGIVYGLLGFIYLRGKFDPQFTITIHSSVMTFMMIWLVLGFVVLSGMANYAHLGGLVVGGLLAMVLPTGRRLKHQSSS